MDHARHRKPRRCVYALNLGGTGISPRTVLVIVLVFVFVLVLVLVPPTKIPPAPGTQQAATYSIAALAGNWTILVTLCYGSGMPDDYLTTTIRRKLLQSGSSKDLQTFNLFIFWWTWPKLGGGLLSISDLALDNCSQNTSTISNVRTAELQDKISYRLRSPISCSLISCRYNLFKSEDTMQIKVSRHDK